MTMTIKKGMSKSGIAQIINKLRAERVTKGLDAYKYCGVIKLKESPSDIQKRLRSEWD